MYFVFFKLDPPEFINPPLTQFDIVENQSNSFNQTARGNPSTISYKWKREDDSEIQSSGSRLIADGPVLNISQAQRLDSGIYKLYASNELGTSETSIRVNVQCKLTLNHWLQIVIYNKLTPFVLLYRSSGDKENKRIGASRRT